MASCRPRIATEVPKALDVRLEIMKAARPFAANEEDEWVRRRRAEIAAIRRELDLLRDSLELLRDSLPGLTKRIVDEVRRDCAPLLRAYRKAYNPDEPRVPAGNPRGGEWTSGGASGPSNQPTTPSGPDIEGSSSSGVQYAQADTGTRTDASAGGDDPISAKDIPADDPKHPVPFVNSQGIPVTDAQSNPLLRPADLPPAMYVRAGLSSNLGLIIAAYEQIEQNDPEAEAGLPAVLYFELNQLGQGGALDAERYGLSYVTDYRDYANIGIGLFMAAANVDIDDALTMADIYAEFRSKFSTDETMDQVYTHLAERDVRDVRLGYQLYNSGRISLRN